MPEIIQIEQRVTRKAYLVELTGRQIIDLLQKSGFEVPPRAEVTVEVPSGADWSGMNLDVGEDTKVRVTWTETDPERIQ